MDDKRREKLVSRLKKCLALSASPEPHEAAAALRQAQKLMRELGMTEADLEGLEMADTLVKTREGFGACATMTYLVNTICSAFGIESVHERNPGSANRLNVRYIGPADRVMLAEYSHRVVWRAMQAAWDAHLALRPHLKGLGGQRQAFHMGWLKGVREKIEALVPTDSEQRAIAAYTGRLYGTALVTVETGPKSLDSAAYNSGQQASKDFSLHVPVEEQQLGLEHIA